MIKNKDISFIENNNTKIVFHLKNGNIIVLGVDTNLTFYSYTYDPFYQIYTDINLKDTCNLLY